MKHNTITYINYYTCININYQKKGTSRVNLNIKDTFQITMGIPSRILFMLFLYKKSSSKRK